MYWSELYSAMVSEESGSLAEDRRRRQLSRPAAAPSPKEIQQDNHIRMVERENFRLKGAFAALVHVLVKKHVIDDVDVRTVVDEATSLRPPI